MKNYGALQNGSDIRGVAMAGESGKPVDLTPEAVVDLTLAFVLWLAAKTEKKREELTVAVGRDSRLTGPELLRIVCETLAGCGVQVLCCGMASTPAMYMATVFPEVAADGAIMITASHLPKHRNGFKYFSSEGGLDSEDIASIVGTAEALAPFTPSREGAPVETLDLMALYTAHLRSFIADGLGASEEDRPLEGLHVVVDAGNGAGGFFATDILAPLGADTTGSQFLEPDGTFPNHPPNPEDAGAMESVSAEVKRSGADLGLLFDTAVDRSAAVGEDGQAIAGNRIVALAAALLKPGAPGRIVVTDSITSDRLTGFLEDVLGLSHFRYKRGYRNVIAKAIELNEEGEDCPLAVETSGHAAYRDNYFLDDGAYLAALITIRAAQLKREGKGIRSLIEALSEPAESLEIRIPIRAEGASMYADGVLMELESLLKSGPCTEEAPCEGRCRCGMSLVLPNYEGIRVACDEENGDGWFLLRKSLHEPLMPLNIESNTTGGTRVIAGKVADLLSIYSALDLDVLRE